jgi:hypothetical protein
MVAEWDMDPLDAVLREVTEPLNEAAPASDTEKECGPDEGEPLP